MRTREKFIKYRSLCLHFSITTRWFPTATRPSFSRFTHQVERIKVEPYSYGFRIKISCWFNTELRNRASWVTISKIKCTKHRTDTASSSVPHTAPSLMSGFQRCMVGHGIHGENCSLNSQLFHVPYERCLPPPLPTSGQHQGIDRPGVRQVSEGSGEQRKLEKTGCEIICGVSTTLAVKGQMMMSGAMFCLVWLSLALLYRLIHTTTTTTTATRHF